jgi:hypothetical protein
MQHSDDVTMERTITECASPTPGRNEALERAENKWYRQTIDWLGWQFDEVTNWPRTGCGGFSSSLMLLVGGFGRTCDRSAVAYMRVDEHAVVLSRGQPIHVSVGLDRSPLTVAHKHIHDETVN